MVRTVKSDIKFKIFTIKEVIEIAKIFEKIANSAKNKDRNNLTYKVFCEGGTEYGDTNIRIFTDDLISLERIKQIDIHYYNFSNETDVKISVRNGRLDTFIYNQISVQGPDNTWVNGIHTEIINVIDKSKNQNKFFSDWNFKKSLSLLCIIFTTLMILTVISMGKLLPPTQEKELLAMISIAVWFSVGVISVNISAKIDKIIYEIYPNIEIQMGPNHMLKEKNRRKFLASVLLTLIFPNLISLFLFLI